MGGKPEFIGFLERGYVSVWIPKGMRKPILEALRKQGFGSIADLVRTATREYLERRGYLERQRDGLKAPQPAI